MAEHVRILHLEDNPLDAKLAQLTLEEVSDQICVSVKHVLDKEQYLAALEVRDFDIILSDYRMPDYDGDEALRAARARCPDVPFIMVTGELGEDRAVETLQRGATDYVIKDRIFRLVPAIRRAMAEARHQRELKKAAESLRMQAALIDLSPDAILVRTVAGEIVFWNNGCEELYGWSRDEALGKTTHSLLRTEFPVPFPEVTGKLRTEGMWSGELVQTTRQERRIIVQSRWRWYERGDEEPWLMESNVDITRHIETEAELREANRRFTALREQSESDQRRSNDLLEVVLNGVTDGCTVYDADFRFIYIGQATARHLRSAGKDPDALIGKVIWDIYPELSGTIAGEKLREAMLRRVPVAYQVRFHDVWYNARAFPLTNGGLAVIFLETSSFRDVQALDADQVTELKQDRQDLLQMNEDLEQAVRRRTAELTATNRELEAFSYSVSHDLKAPLRGVSGFARILSSSDQVRLTPQQKEAVALILQGVQQMEGLINALLEFSHLGRGSLHVQTVHTASLVQQVLEEQRRTIGESAVRVRARVDDLPDVQADPVLLRLVFTNLLSNALKFTRPVDQPVIEIGGRRQEHDLLVWVRDNGVGFPKEHAEELFNVFRRLHSQSEFEGTGVGLANVRRIIERHGGQVCAEGEEGKGATFYFTLPLDSSSLPR